MGIATDPLWADLLLDNGQIMLEKMPDGGIIAAPVEVVEQQLVNPVGQWTEYVARWRAQGRI